MSGRYGGAMPPWVAASIIVPVCLLAVGSVMLLALTQARAGGSNTAEPTEDFFSGSVHYAIPTKYHAGISAYSAKRDYAAMTMTLFLPDLSPASEHPEELKRPGWRDQMTLLFEHGPHWGTADQQIAILTDRPGDAHTPPEPAANGCTLYRTPLMVPGDVYACPEDGSKLVLRCDRKSDVPFPACTIFENIGSDLGVIIHYSAKYAADAVSIDRRIKALITSFAQQQSQVK